MEDIFNPLDWIEPENGQETGEGRQETGKNCREQGAGGMGSPDMASEVDTVVARIEAAFTDITTSYNDWLNVGFAFAHEFGEAGRSFFQRVSRFYPGFSLNECNKQYDQCLKSHGHGITIKTFFHMAKQAGIEVKRRGGEGTTERGDEEMKERGYESTTGRGDEGTTTRGYEGGCGQAQCSDSNDPGDSFVPSSSRPLVPSSPDDSFVPSSHRPIVPSSSGNSLVPSSHRPIVPSSSGNSLVPSSHRPIVPSSSDDSFVPSSSEEDPAPEPQQPTLPDFIFDQVPDFFKRVVSRADSKEERDILFLGSMVALGSCLTTFSGSYDGNTVYPSLFLYIAARASSGKGRLVMCRNLVNPIHWEKRNQNEKENLLYEVEMREYNMLKGKDLSAEKPERPPVRLHFIPANNSTAGFLQLIGDNNGEGLIIETEGDTIAQALKTDYGNFSDALRKGFHHEVISCYRKTDRVHLAVEHPRFSMILSSTIGQLKNLIPSTENGLSSRFIFYYMNLRPIWKDVFAHSGDKSLDQHFDELGQDFYSLYKTLRATDPIQFSLTDDQKEAFNAFFAQMQDKYLVLQGLDYLAIVRRLGLIAFRMMMILTAMRIPETGDYSTHQQCGQEDFQATLAIIKTMVRHASYIVSQLPEEVKVEKRGNKKERFFEGLPERFNRKEYVELAKSLGITDRTSDNYMVAFCTKGLVLREQNNSYIKIVTS